MQARAHYRRGQIAVILTLAVPALIAAIAFGTDIAVLYMNWTQLQRSTDTAVSAGAVYLPSDPNEAIIAARSYARICGIRSDEIVATQIGADHTSISMTVTRRVSLITRFLGLAEGNIAANATATVRSARPGNSLKAHWLRA
jgi:Flp pilus assembly protein TadG